MANPPRKRSPHFFTRDGDGSVRVRVRFDADEAALFEEAAGSTPVMLWIHQALRKAAQDEVRKHRRTLKNIPPPVD